MSKLQKESYVFSNSANKVVQSILQPPNDVQVSLFICILLPDTLWQNEHCTSLFNVPVNRNDSTSNIMGISEFNRKDLKSMTRAAI